MKHLIHLAILLLVGAPLYMYLLPWAIDLNVDAVSMVAFGLVAAYVIAFIHWLVCVVKK